MFRKTGKNTSHPLPAAPTVYYIHTPKPIGVAAITAGLGSIIAASHLLSGGRLVMLALMVFFVSIFSATQIMNTEDAPYTVTATLGLITLNLAVLRTAVPRMGIELPIPHVPAMSHGAAVGGAILVSIVLVTQYANQEGVKRILDLVFLFLRPKHLFPLILIGGGAAALDLTPPVVLWALTALFAGITLSLSKRTHEDEVVSSDDSLYGDRAPVREWNKHLAWYDPETDKGGALADFRLIEPIADVMDQRDGATPVGWEAVVACPPASKGAGDVRQQSERIATTMHVGPSDIEIVPTADHARPLIRVIHRSVLSEGSIPWAPGGVDLERGTIELGTYADGMRSKYQLWESNGQTWHGWFCGGTGGGKSTAMHGLLGRALSTGQVVLDMVPIGGGSMYAWRDKAYRYGTKVEDAELALRRGVAVMDARAEAAADIEWYDLRAKKTRRGRDPLPPGDEWPVYWVVIDEFPRLQGLPKGSTAQADFKRIAAEGRKWRVALLVASQGATLKETWWNDAAIRENVRQGNVAVFRGSKGSATLALDGVEAAYGVSDIPPGVGGMGYVVSKVSSRAMLSRADWVDDADDRPDGVPSSWEVADFAQVTQPNPIDLIAIKSVER